MAVEGGTSTNDITKPKFEVGGVTKEQLVKANNLAYKGADLLRQTIKDRELQIDKYSDTINKLRQKIQDLEVKNGKLIEVKEQQIEDLENQIRINKDKEILVLKEGDWYKTLKEENKIVCEWKKNAATNTDYKWLDIVLALNQFLALKNCCVVDDSKNY